MAKATLDLRKRFGGLRTQIRAALPGWLGLIKRRWPGWLLVLALLGLAGTCWGLSQHYSSAVVGFFEQRAQRDQHGIRWQRYDFNDWTGIADQTGVSRALVYKAPQTAFMKGTNFNVRFSALLDLKKPRKLRLGVASDDGAVLFIDGRRIVENLGYHPLQAKSKKLRLAAGHHSLEVLYHQEGGNAELQVLFPREVALNPLPADFDPGRLWRLNRQVEWWSNRGLVLVGFAFLLAALLLCPRPRSPGKSLAAWLRHNWPEIALVGGFGVLLGWGLNENPGLCGDPAHFGITAFEWQNIAPVLHYWSTYTNQEMMIWPVYLLQKLFPLSVGLIRSIAVTLNLIGLFLLAQASREIFGRKVSCYFVLAVGASVWFLFFGRYFVEMHTFLVFSLGGFFWSLAISRRIWWVAGIGPLFLMIGVYAHGLLAVAAVSAGAFCLVWLPRLITDKRFWLAVATAILSGAPWELKYFGGGIGDFGHPKSLAALPGQAWWVLSEVLPNMIDGRYLALFSTGQIISFWPPVASLLILSALLSWPWLRTGSAIIRRTLFGLALFTITAFIVTLVKAPIDQGPEQRYFEVIVVGAFLWAGLVLALWAAKPALPGIFGKLAVAVLALAGLYGYIAGCYLPYARTGGLCAEVPGIMMTSMRKMDKRGLHHEMAKQGRPVSFPYWDRRSLEFHEMEDLTGRSGLRAQDEYHKGNMLVNVKCSRKYGRRPAELFGLVRLKPSPYLRSYPLPPRVNNKYVAYIRSDN